MKTLTITVDRSVITASQKRRPLPKGHAESFAKDNSVVITDKQCAKLMRIYKAARFFVSGKDYAWLPLTWAKEPMAVISAWNPYGKKAALDKNLAADAKLYSLLIERGIYPLRAKGESPNGLHYEHSWLVPYTDEWTIKALAFTFSQLAIYVVTKDCRYIEWTMSNRAPSTLPKAKR